MIHAAAPAANDALPTNGTTALRFERVTLSRGGRVVLRDVDFAVRSGELHEIKSSIILQPGPAALTDGLTEIHAHLARWTGMSVPGEKSRS